MYIFFWFFKQLFYTLKRFTKHKFLLLLVFFVLALFLFIKPQFAVNINDYTYTTELPTAVYDCLHNYSIFNNIDNYYYFIAFDGTYYHCYSFNKSRYTSNFKPYIYTYSDDGLSLTIRVNENALNNNTSSVGNYFCTTAGVRKGESAENWTMNHNYVFKNNGTSYLIPLETNMEIYTDNNFSSTWYPSMVPYIVNDTDIPTWSFTRLLINVVNLSLELPEGQLGTYTYFLNYNYNEQDVFTIPINDYFLIDENSGTHYFSVPQNLITNNIILRPNYTIRFSLTRVDRFNNSDYFELGTYTLTLSQADADILNENNYQQQISSINNEQQQTTQAIEGLNNTITDTTLDDSSISFPALNIPDLTRDGLTHIFDAFVLAFCDGDPQDIIVPIPYTNKTFTIPYNYTYNMLNTYAPVLLNFIRLYWWYKIALIIALDIYDKMDKLQSGDVEHVQNENITTNML